MNLTSEANKKFQKELNSGTASLVLLGVLDRAEEPMYGYQIAKLIETHDESVQMMKQGALYPVLRSLENIGLLESHVDPSVSGPPRRYYKITKATSIHRSRVPPDVTTRSPKPDTKRSKPGSNYGIKQRFLSTQSWRERKMFNTVDEYLKQLKHELRGYDPALIQDALSDAEEFLRTALMSAQVENPDISEKNALGTIIHKYGSPDEIASAYKEIESRISPSLTTGTAQRDRSSLLKFLGIYGDSQAWAAVLYLLFSAVTGVIFGFWTIIGAGISLCTIFLIIGLPLLGLYLFSLRGIALIEGRMVEALLGIRMPRKPIFIQKGLTLSKKLRVLWTESLTWKIFLYLVTRFPLGFVYSFGLLILMAFAVKFIAYPVLAPVFERSLFTIGEQKYNTSIFFYPFVSLAGFVLLTLTLHLAKWVGKLHGRFAKSMLVRKEPDDVSQ